MKTKGMKRIFALLLVPILLLAAPVIPANAAGNLEGVDYTRIHENETLKKEVTFLIGDMSFDGWLTNGETLTDEEVDEIIRGVMTREKITSGMLIGAHQRAANALEVNNNAIPYSAAAEFLLAMADIGSAEELSRIVTGSKPIPTDIGFYTTVLTETALNKVFSYVLTGIGGNSFATAFSFAQNAPSIALRELYAYIDREEAYLQNLAAALALERFYALCNAEIQKAEEEKGVNQWRITCAQTQWKDVALFDCIPVIQWRRLECDLERTTAGESWGGAYQGKMKLDIWHDMTNFDQEFFHKIYLGPFLPFYKTDVFFENIDKYTQTSTLTKTLTNSEFRLVLDAGLIEGGELRRPFSLTGFEDRSSFWSYHPVEGGFRGAGMQNGVFDFQAPYVHAHSEQIQKQIFVGEMDETNMGIHIDVYGWNLTNEGYVIAPGQSSQHDMSDSGMDRGTILWDTKVYSDLRITPEIRIGN